MSDTQAAVVMESLKQLSFQDSRDGVTSSILKWKYFQAVLNYYQGLLESFKNAKKVFTAKVLKYIEIQVKLRDNSFTGEEKEELAKITALSMKAKNAIEELNGLVRRIDTIIEDVLRIMNRKRERTYVDLALRRLQKNLADSVVPKIDPVNSKLLQISDDAKSANTSVEYLIENVTKSIEKFPTLSKCDCVKTRLKAYGGVSVVTAITAVACYLIPPVTLAVGIGTTTAMGVTSFGGAGYITETMTIPEIKAGRERLEDLKNFFKTMMNDTKAIADEMNKQKKALDNIEEALFSANESASDVLEEDDGMFDDLFDLLKDSLEKTKKLCNDYLKMNED